MYKYRRKKGHAKPLPRSSNIGGQGEGKQIKNLKYLHFLSLSPWSYQIKPYSAVSHVHAKWKLKHV